MGIDLSKVQDKLSKLRSKNNKSQYLWKPQPGNSTIRIVPYKYNKDFPFIELFFHYDFPGDNYLSPRSVGEADPIYEFAQTVRNMPGDDNYEIFKKLNPKRRTFAPVIVRGEEDEGVRFWGFGKTIYEQLLATMADPDWGDITDPKNGRDIKIEYIPGKQTSNGYPETKLMVRPKSTPLVEDMEQAKQIYEDQVEITEVFTVPSYEELERALQSYINGSDKFQSIEGGQSQTQQVLGESDGDLDDDDETMEDFEAMFGEG